MEIVRNKCKFNLHLGIYRECDIEIYLVPPIIELYDIDINMIFPKIKKYDTLFTLIREFETDHENFKKADNIPAYSFTNNTSFVNIKSFTDLYLFDTKMYAFTNLSELLQIPQGTIENIKSINMREYFNIPLSDEYFIVNKTNVNTNKIFRNDLYNGCLFYRIQNEKIIDFSYLEGVNINFDSDNTPYEGHFICYLYVPNTKTITFGVWSNKESDIIIDGYVEYHLNGGEGSNYTSNTFSFEFLKGWHIFDIKFKSENSTDRIDFYFKNNNGNWLQFTHNNIVNSFEKFKYVTPLKFTYDEIIELINNPPLIPVELYPSIFKDNDYILLKNITQNVDILNNLKFIVQTTDITINTISGNINGTLPLNNICETNSGTFIEENSEIEIINNELTNIDYLLIFLSKLYNTQTNYTNNGNILEIKFFNSSDEIINNVKQIIEKESYNIQILPQTTLDTIYLKILTDNDFIKIKFNNFYWKKMSIKFLNNTGYIKLFTFINRKKPDFKIIGYANEISDTYNVNIIRPIKYDNINLLAIKEINVPKGIVYLSEYITINQSKKEYTAKLLNIDMTYTINYG